MLRGWLELFDRFIESIAVRTASNRETASFEIARHACGMVLVLLLVIGVITFQAVATMIDYSTLKDDYTELNVAYLRHSDVFSTMNKRLGNLENSTEGLRTDNSNLQQSLNKLYKDNSTLMARNKELRDLYEQCRNPNYQPKQ